MIFSEWLKDVYGHININDLINNLIKDGFSEEDCEVYINKCIQQYREYCNINKIEEEYDF